MRWVATEEQSVDIMKSTFLRSYKPLKLIKMKKLISLAIIICLISCSKSNPTNPPVPASFTKYFKGKLNGVPFYDSTLAEILSFSPPDELHLQGFHANGGIGIDLKSFNFSTGERLVNNSNKIWVGNSGVYYSAGLVNPGNYIRGSGKVNIQEITNDYIKGTFECVAPTDTAFYGPFPPQLITEGEFKLKRK